MNEFIETMNRELNYLTILAYTALQHYNSDRKNGAYFWLKKISDDKYLLYYHNGQETQKETLEATEEDMEIVLNQLKNDGFEVNVTERNNILLTITGENIRKMDENHNKNHR